MKAPSIPRVVIPALALLFAGCASTPAQRIAGNAAFDTYPSEVQEKILNGEVDLGFNGEMVQLALGQPDRVSRRQTPEGESEVWSYNDKTPRFSIGFGISSGGRHTRTGTGVMIGGRDWSDGARTRVIFREGKVSAIETREG